MNDPVAVWHDKDGTPVIVEGHGRVLALQKLNIVIHPDWQGIGLGRMLATTVAQHVSLQYDCFLQTSNTAMKHALLHHDDWKLIRNNINLMDRKHAAEHARKTGNDLGRSSRRVKTASFVIRKHE